MEDVIEKLKDLGFNSYEAKVYVALLKKYPATGYEVSQIADIPQARAYDTLKSLVVKKVVFSSDDKPQKYSPIAPKELTQRFKRKMSSTIDYLEKKLPNVKEDYNEPIHNIYGYDNILNKVKEIIQNAEKSIYLQIWNVDFKQIESILEVAYDKGIDIKVAGYDVITSPFGMMYSHEGFDHSASSRLVYLLADECESVFGHVESKVVWTKNSDIANLLRSFIVHDMYLLDINKQFPEQLKYFYGRGFKKLREKIFPKSSVRHAFFNNYLL